MASQFAFPRAGRRLLCLLLALLLPALLLPALRPVFAEAPQPVPAVDPVSRGDSFTAVLYNNTNGLPTSEANDIAQTAEGFIWIGSYSGLIRYDGKSFERMDSTGGIASVVRLYVDRKDRLWIGTNDSGVAMMDRGELRQWRMEDGLGSDKIRTITGDDEGRIYVGTTAGITVFDEALEPRPLSDPRIAEAYMETMLPGADGCLYCTTNAADFFVLSGGELETFIDHSETCVQNIKQILPDPDEPGAVYVGTTDSVLYRGDLTQGIEAMEAIDISPLRDVGSIARIGDQLWISARNGVGVLDRQGVHLVENLPMDNSIRIQMIDYEGNIWCTSSRQGVMKLVPNPFLDVFARCGVPSAVVNSTCLYDGCLFVATDTGLIVLEENDWKESLPLESAKTASGEELGCSDLLELLEGCRIRSVIRDSRGRLWISTWYSLGLLCYDGASVTAFTPAEGMLSDRVRAVCETEDGAILAAVTGGVNLIRDSRVVAGWGEKDGIANSESLTVAAAPNGDIVLGSNGGGIYVVPTEELLQNGEIKPVHYGIANGLPCIATSNSYSELTEEGDLYIAGGAGVAKVNIEASLENVSDLKQAVPFIDADGLRIYPDENGGFTLPSTVRKLTIYVFVFNYSLTDPQITYHLEGFDQEAVTVSRSELGPVSYTNLSGGSYEFVMELKDAMGRGSKVLSVPIVKEKALYEHWSFYLGAGLLAVLAAALLVRAYIRRKMRLLEEKHREDAKRERLENELQMAAQIQASMLPRSFPAFPERKEFELFASMDPAKEVGGDFYDFFLIDDDHLGLVIADVSGKGIPAALFMMVSMAMIKNCAMSGLSPAAALESVNRQVCANNQEDMFVTVWLGVLEISTGKLTAANAGHEYPALKEPEGGFALYKDKHGLVVGGMDGIVYREYELLLSPGTKLFVYTDGVPEATNRDNELFGSDRMLDALNQDPDAGPEALLRNVRRAVDAFVGDAEQFDDLTMLCLEYKKDSAQEEGSSAS